MSTVARAVTGARTYLRQALAEVLRPAGEPTVASLEAAKGAAAHALEALESALAAMRAEASVEKAERAAEYDGSLPSWMRPSPAVCDPQEALEWAARQVWLGRGRPIRYVIVESQDKGGSLACVKSDSRNAPEGACIRLGGALAIRCLQGWPRTTRGGVSHLGISGVVRLLGGTGAVDRVKGRAGEIEDLDRRRNERRTLLKEIEEALQIHPEISAHMFGPVAESDKALDAYLLDLSTEHKQPDLPSVKARLDLVGELFGRVAGWADDVRFHFDDAGPYVDARRAAIRSSAELRRLLQGWIGGDAPSPLKKPAVFAALTELRIQPSRALVGDLPRNPSAGRAG